MKQIGENVKGQNGDGMGKEWDYSRLARFFAVDRRNAWGRGRLGMEGRRLYNRVRVGDGPGV